jgi:hypothetical protein
VKREMMRIADGKYQPEGQFLWEASFFDLRILKRASEGNVLPAGCGVAWVEYDRASAVCAPVPLNFLLGWAVRAWWRLKRGPGHCARCGR